ncbi:MAG: VCBS repeat-containing protein, partial [Phycisphaerales bacterium]
MRNIKIWKERSYLRIISSLPIILALFFLTGTAGAIEFDHVVVDKNIGGRTAIGDIDGDGFNDIVVHTWSSNRGKQNDGKIGWYRYPNWRRYSIVDSGHIFGDGVLAVDLDLDGDNDVVTAKGSDNEASVFWYENPGGRATPTWQEHKIATVERASEVKDVEVHDMDHDGKPDVVVRTKHKFAIYFQQSPDSWIEVKTDNAEREGMIIGDVDG